MKDHLTRMEKLITCWEYIVGPGRGYTGKGNEQWYYSLALAINLMLVWWLKPEIALWFTILSIIHYATLIIYGFFDLSDKNIVFSYAYLMIHLFLFFLATIASLVWTVITSAIVLVSILLAPDGTENNIILNKNTIILPLIFNTIILLVFCIIEFCLPINFWRKLEILLVVLLIHPFIDWLEGECVNVFNSTLKALHVIKESMDELIKDFSGDDEDDD